MLVMGHAFRRRLKANKRKGVDGPRTPDASGALAGLRAGRETAVWIRKVLKKKSKFPVSRI